MASLAIICSSWSKSPNTRPQPSSWLPWSASSPNLYQKVLGHLSKLETSKAPKTSLAIVPESSSQSVRPILQIFLCYERLFLRSFHRSEVCFDLRKTSKRFNAENVCARSKFAQHGIETLLANQLSRGNGLTDFVQGMCC